MCHVCNVLCVEGGWAQGQNPKVLGLVPERHLWSLLVRRPQPCPATQTPRRQAGQDSQGFQLLLAPRVHLLVPWHPARNTKGEGDNTVLRNAVLVPTQARLGDALLIRISWSKLKAQAAGSTGTETTSPGRPLASGIPSSPAQGQDSSATDAQQRSWDLSPDGSLPQELSREPGHVSMQEPAKRQKLRKITTKAKCNPHRCHLSQSCPSGPRGRRVFCI